MALRQSATQSVQCVPLGAIIPLQKGERECCHAIPNRCRGDEYGFTGANAPFMLCPLTAACRGAIRGNESPEISSDRITRKREVGRPRFDSQISTSRLATICSVRQAAPW